MRTVFGVTLALVIVAQVIPTRAAGSGAPSPSPTVSATPVSNPDIQRQYDAGMAALQAQDYKRALPAFEAGLAIALRVHDVNWQATFHKKIGVDDDDLGRYSDALQSYGQALALYRQLGDRDGEARTLGNVGVVDDDLGRYGDAVSLYGQSLTLSRQLGDRDLEAIELGNIGNVEAHLGRYSDARRSFGQLLVLDRQLSNRLGEAIALNSIGVVDASLGRYSDALSLYGQSLVLERQLGDRVSEAIALRNIGVVDEDLGRHSDALQLFGQALTLSRQLGNRSLEAVTLSALGYVDKDLGRYSDALQLFGQSLTLERRLGPPDSEATDLGNIGDVDEHLGRYNDALQLYRRALALYRKLGVQSGETWTLQGVASVERHLHSYGDALTNARRAVILEREMGLPKWEALHLAAASEAQLNRIDGAMFDYDAALEDIERLRSGLSQANRSSFFAQTTYIYDEYVAYLLKLHQRFPKRHYDSKALQIFERRQARAFLEDVARSEAGKFRGADLSRIIADENSLDVTITNLQSQLAKASFAQHPSRELIASLHSVLTNQKAQQNALQAQIKQKYPTYYALQHPHPLDVSALQRLLNRREAMLVYDVLPASPALWVVTRGSARLFILPGGSRLARAKVNAFLNGPLSVQASTGLALTAVQRKANRNLGAFSKSAFDLYRWLLPADARAMVGRTETLFIVPSGPLYAVPFEALVTRPSKSGTPHYLIEDHAVAYLSSASLLGVLREKQRSHAPSPLLAFANPTYDEPASLPSPAGEAATAQARTRALMTYVRGGSVVAGFPPLPGTESEANAVAAALHAGQASIHLHDDASLQTVNRLNAANTLKDYRYLLFATHAVLPNQVSAITQPSLVLAHPSMGGYLTMGDVFGLTLDAQLVMLSACDSNGKTTNGDGVQSLTQAFMYAGTPTVSVTDWEILDNVAPAFSGRFFALLAQGKTPAQALRRTKLDLIQGKLHVPGANDDQFQHPFFWAATVLFGAGDLAGS